MEGEETTKEKKQEDIACFELRGDLLDLLGRIPALYLELDTLHAKQDFLEGLQREVFLRSHRTARLLLWNPRNAFPVVEHEVKYGWERAHMGADSVLFSRRKLQLDVCTDQDCKKDWRDYQLVVTCFDASTLLPGRRWEQAIDMMQLNVPVTEDGPVQMVFVFQNEDDVVEMPTHIWPYGKRNLECRLFPKGKSSSPRAPHGGHWGCMVQDAIQNIWRPSWIKPGYRYDVARCNLARTDQLLSIKHPRV